MHFLLQMPKVHLWQQLLLQNKLDKGAIYHEIQILRDSSSGRFSGCVL